MNIYYRYAESRFGSIALLWNEEGGEATLRRVLLPRDQVSALDLMRSAYGEPCPGRHPLVDEIAERITRFVGGEAITFGLERVGLHNCSPFQQRVLLAEHAIPRGKVSTYGYIARHLGTPSAARAVGRALATNPFPIIIPCHRAVRSSGELGGFQGGLAMKRALLAQEGTAFAADGRVILDHPHYAA